MSKITVHKQGKLTISGARGIAALNAGETFRFRFGRDDKVYMRITDERAQDQDYENVLERFGYGDNAAFYASFSGQVYRARGNEDIVRVRVTATSERE